MWTLFSFFYLYLAAMLNVPSPFLIAIKLAVVTALIPSLTVLSLERILKRLCTKWKYSKFHFVQLFSKATFLMSEFCVVGIYAITLLYPQQILVWIFLLLFVLMAIMFFSLPLTDFFSTEGEAVLCFRTFLWEFEKESNYANFGKLFLASKKISQIAKVCNMQVSPYSLSLGMTISFLENKLATRKDLEDLIEWIEVSTETKNFENFKEIVKRYCAVAEDSAKHGIMEKSHWTFERFVALLGNIVIPLAVAGMVIVVPKLIEMILKF